MLIARFWLVFSLFVFFCSISVISCKGRECDRYKCSQDPILLRPIDPYLRPEGTFTSPCSCLTDWNDLFCNTTQAILTAPASVSFELPTVCICRKFSDNNSKCQQFIARCFNKRNKECSCCFNQPYNYCNHLKCKNGEPDFGLSNTTCVCHSNPADYPYQICESYHAKGKERLTLHSLRESAKNGKDQKHTFLGLQITTSLIWYIILGAALLLSSLIIVMLVAGNRKLRQRREDVSRQRQAAHEALLMTRADEDRYLPTA